MQRNTGHPDWRAGLSGAVLGIESSCDETAVAVYDARQGLLAHQIFSQVATHERFGGVVPELASRDHCRKLIPLVAEAIDEAGVRPKDLTALAYTAGPGLIGALLVGATTACGLAMAWDLPVVPVHHMEGHLLAPLLEDDPPDFPFVALLVSGGHSMLVDVAGFGDYRVLGQTLDDAAGEAFDKTAKLLCLPYPGGPALAALADRGDGTAYDFPRPMLKRPGLEFSFSGLKTAVMLKVRELEAGNALSDDARANVAAAFQEAVVDTLVAKSLRALEHTQRRRLVVAGGVGANLALRERLADELASRGSRVYYPRIEFCTDNGAMIALTGLLRRDRQASFDYDVVARARWHLEELNG